MNRHITISDAHNVTVPASDGSELLGFPLAVTPEHTITMFRFRAAWGNTTQEGETGVEHADATEQEMIDAINSMLDWYEREEFAERFDA